VDTVIMKKNQVVIKLRDLNLFSLLYCSSLLPMQVTLRKLFFDHLVKIF